MEKYDEVTAYPLAWPEGWARTPRHQRAMSRYRRGFTRPRRELVEELVRFGAQNVVVSTNIILKRDGSPYADELGKAFEPNDPGVAVYWMDREGQPAVMACDSWHTVRENMRAITMSIEAFRKIERAKAGEVLKRACQGLRLGGRIT